MAEYTFYWLTGDKEILDGGSPEDAANAAGYGAGAMRALDFWARGECTDYEWVDGHWEWTSEKRAAVMGD